jgi:restriction system protein
VYGTALPEDLSATSGISQLLEEARPRHILTLMPQSRAWDGLLSLNDLFEGEHVASSPESYLDQRFIDYLAAQPGHLSAIHWRQFEHLTGEYFRRNGYIVRIGPGRRDGGVDVIAERTDVTVGPELVVIQCKRFGDNNPIGVDSVRAFWATVTDQNATRGLIATTSRLTIGAKDYCDARRYRLGAADAANVGQWLTQMARRPSRAG